jgi:uncharacterized protein YkwD
VTRAATSDDNIATATVRRPQPRRRDKPRWLGSLLFALLFALMLGGAAAAVLFRADLRPGPQWDTTQLDRLRRAGDFVAARAELAAMRAAVGSDVRLLQHADSEQELLDSVAAAVAGRRQAIVNGSETGDFAALSQRLDRAIAQSTDDAAREAAQIVRSGLLELLRERGAAAVAAAQAAATEPETVGAPAADVVPSPAPKSNLLADVDRLVGEGRFVLAQQTIDAGLEDADSELAATLQRRAAELRSAAERDAGNAIAAARAEARNGKADAAIADLDVAAHRFPSGTALAAIVQAQTDIAVAAATRRQPAADRPAAPAVDEAVRAASLEKLRALMQQIHAAEADGDFAVVAELQRRSAEMVAAADPAFAERLRQQAAEADLLVELHARAGQALTAGKKTDVLLRNGQLGTVIAADGCRLVTRGDAGEQKITWLDLASRGVQTLVEQQQLPLRAYIGAAVLAFRNGDAEIAEAMLQKVVAGEPALQPAVDGVLARGRGEAPDPRGYQLVGGKFVATRTVEARKAAEKIAARLESVVRSKDQKARDAFVAETMAQSTAAKETIVIAFQRELEKQVDALGKSTLKKQVDRLSAQRDLLDAARHAARTLIFDEVKYFYPYKPPAVSAEKAKEYAEVQAEVDRRVAAVRVLWNDTAIKVRVPASLRDDLERLDWTAKVLAGLGELDAASLQIVEWARALPPGESVDVRNLCLTVAERQELAECQRIDAWNKEQEHKLTSSQREQLHVTNDYRALFRHRPLALSAKLCASAIGHAEEMSKLGYFSHFSPTPGRHSPVDRMKLAGYDLPGAENIALGDGAQGVHEAWIHSSGHHRAILSPRHSEFGVGALGRYWVQNFGAGTDYTRK